MIFNTVCMNTKHVIESASLNVYKILNIIIDTAPVSESINIL